jgi:hypothetical protein
VHDHLVSTVTFPKIAISAACAMTLAFTTTASAKVLTWACTYPKVSNANGVSGDQDLKFTFTIDDVTGKATIAGNAGTSGVELFAGPHGITFLQRLPSGAIQMTSIDASGMSVHSRHSVVGHALVPSQSYGRCAGSLK